MYYNYKGFYSVVLLAVANYDYSFLFASVGQPGHHSGWTDWLWMFVYHLFIIIYMYATCHTMKTTSDTTIYSESKFARDLPHLVPPDAALPGTSTAMPFVLTADEAFPLSRHVMRPFSRAHLDSGRVSGYDYTERSTFNYRLSRLEFLITVLPKISLKV